MKKKILLVFPPHLTEQPITYNLIKKYDLKINILKASINYNTEGHLLTELEGTKENIDTAVQYLENIGVSIDTIHTKVIWDEKSCVHCGACTALCPSNALKIDKTDWLVSFNDDKCVGCNLCIAACPIKAITNNL